LFKNQKQVTVSYRDYVKAFNNW